MERHTKHLFTRKGEGGITLFKPGKHTSDYVPKRSLGYNAFSLLKSESTGYTPKHSFTNYEPKRLINEIRQKREIKPTKPRRLRALAALSSVLLPTGIAVAQTNEGVQDAFKINPPALVAEPFPSSELPKPSVPEKLQRTKTANHPLTTDTARTPAPDITAQTPPQAEPEQKINETALADKIRSGMPDAKVLGDKIRKQVEESLNVERINTLTAERRWDGEILRSSEADKLEDQITLEKLSQIKLSPEGYEKFKNSINTEFVRAFENAGSLHPSGIIKNPEHFILHHTGMGYKDGKEGVKQFINGMAINGFSVQWLIDREGIAYLLVRNPLQAANHAAPRNTTSTGVEIMTDATRAQGSLTFEQLQASLYLAYYVNTEIYDNAPEDLKSVVGHRHVNEATKTGTTGKPDFTEEVIVNGVLPQLRNLAAVLRNVQQAAA